MPGENDVNAIVKRLMQIVTRETATVQTKNGPVEDEATADKHSLTAAKSLGGFHLRSLKMHKDAGTAGLSASQASEPRRAEDGLKTGESFARSESEYDAGPIAVRLNVDDQNSILNRLMQILCKQTVTVQTKNGPVEDEVTADKNSIAAAKFAIGLQAKYLKHAKDDEDIVRLNEKDEKAITARLMQILSKQTVIVQTKNGPVEDHVIADKNAITCANLLMSGTAGLSASRDGLKIGKSFARCETIKSLDRPLSTHDPLLSGRRPAGLSASPDGLKIGKSLERCETGETPSDSNYTVQDVIREALRLSGAERTDVPDQLGKKLVIEHVRGNLYEARLKESSGALAESAS